MFLQTLPQIDLSLDCIANILMQNKSLVKNIGLRNGKMGVAIFFYRYGRYSKNNIYNSFADQLMDEIFEDLQTLTQVGFANGFTGIGWGIEYLVKNGFLEADTDIVLEELDFRIIKKMKEYSILEESTDILFGLGFYNLARLKEKDNNDNKINTVLEKQQLIFVFKEFQKLLLQNRFIDFNIPLLNLERLNNIIYILLEIYNKNLCKNEIDKLLPYLPSYIGYCLHQNNSWVDEIILLKLLKRIQNQITNFKLFEEYAIIIKEIERKYPKNKVTIDSFIKLHWYQWVFNIPLFENSNKTFIDICYNINNNILKSNQLLIELAKIKKEVSSLADIGCGLLCNTHFREQVINN